MTGLITKAALFAACGMIIAGAAMAGVPSAATSTSVAFLRLAQNTGGVPDTVSSKITITVNDVSHNPVPGSNVVVDFSGCSNDIKIASNQLNANYTTNCTTHTVSAYTNASGVVAFTLLGGSFTTSVYTSAGCAKIYADGVLLSSASVATFDLNGVGGLTAGDISIWVGDLASGTYRPRADLNGDGSLTAGDISVWVGALGRGASSVSGAVCP